MANEQPTYRQLFELLSLFGFRAASTQEKWKAFDHPDADWYFLFVALDPDGPVRETDLTSVRAHLDAWGLLDRAEFNRFAVTGELPRAAAGRS